MALALFDLDRTLIGVNSGRLWVAAEWRHGRIGLADIAWASWWLGRYSLGLHGGLEAAFEAAARPLVGTPEIDLQDRVRTWFDREVRHHLRPGARAALDAHGAAGDRLVLATSSTEYVARAAADAFGLEDGIHTRLEVRDGHFTGRIATLAVGPHKRSAAEAWADREGVDLSEATFYTDSATDLALLERVARPVVVAPDRKLRRLAAARGWPTADW